MSNIQPTDSPSASQDSGVSVNRLHLCIDAYIFKNGFNQYGDHPSTSYKYGTPLLDENTGELMDKYWYVCEMHWVHVNACKACGWTYADPVMPAN